MALSKLLTDLDNVQALSDSPNETEGLTADQLKAKFDEAGNEIKAYLNNTLTVEQDVINTSLDNRLVTAEANITGLKSGWNDISTLATFAYTSADAPTFVMGTSTNLTGVLSVGMKIKLTQTTAKYFFITAIDASTITMYGGTDYILENATITNPSYSTEKAPYGFPLDPDKWSIELLVEVRDSQASPAANTWYNVGNRSLTVPIGLWKLGYNCNGYATVTGNAYRTSITTLSTTTNSDTHPQFKKAAYAYLAANSASLPRSVENYVSLAEKTVFYLLVSTDQSGVLSLAIDGGFSSTKIKCTIAYL